MSVLSNGINKLDVVGKSFFSLLPDNEEEKLMSILRKDTNKKNNRNAVHDGHSQGDLNHYYQCSQDLTLLSKTYDEVYIRVYYTKDERNNTISCHCEDITKLKEAENEKLDAQRLLDAEKNLTEWLSHEIRNPLTIALEAAESIKQYKEKNDEAITFADSLHHDPIAESKFLVDLIINSISYVVDLLSKMLDLNKVVEGKIALSPSICSLREDIFEPIIQMMNVRKKNLTISIQGEEIKLYIDKLRLKQVVTNLLSNALKFTEKGFIMINSYRSTKDKDGNDIADSLFISVSDSGQGVSTQNLGLLFSKWEQLGSNRNGTGIGLCLCRFLVQAMGGVIYFNDKYRSNVEGFPGAQFVIQFPIDKVLASTKVDNNNNWASIHNVPAYTALSDAVRASAADNEDFHIAARQNSFTSNIIGITNESYVVGEFKVLIVDDSPVIRKLLSRRITRMFPQSKITEANNGEEAIQFASFGPQFDLIFIDQFMGEGLCGDETIKMLRERNIDSLIFGISGNDKQYHHKLAGAEDFIQKPIPQQNHILMRLLKYLAPPSGWTALIVGPDEKSVQDIKRQLYIVAAAHFTTFEEAEKRMSVVTCSSVHEAKAKMRLKRHCFDLLIVDSDSDSNSNIDTFAYEEEGLKDNAVIILNSTSPLTQEPTRRDVVFWPKPLPAVDQLRKSLVTKLVRPRVSIGAISG